MAASARATAPYSIRNGMRSRTDGCVRVSSHLEVAEVAADQWRSAISCAPRWFMTLLVRSRKVLLVGSRRRTRTHR
jgi:hypothetical protein